MNSINRIIFVALVALLATAFAFVPRAALPLSRVAGVDESITKLFAHHVEKKIIKKKQDRAPKKHRLSDINRNNQNDGKCITKVANAPAEYTLIAAGDQAGSAMMKASANFWNSGSSSAPWLEITSADMEVILPTNRDPLPEGGVQKKPKLARQLPY